MKSNIRELRLIFRQWGFWNPYYFKIDWPRDKPLTVATLDTFDSGSLIDVGSIDASFVIANMPVGSKVYFAVPGENGHQEIEEMLRSNGDSFQQVTTRHQRRRSRLSGFILGRISTKRRIFFGSTHRTDIVNALFKIYASEWYVKSQLLFLIAEKDPLDWVEQLEGLSGPRNQRLVRSSIIETSHCLLTTLWEHGMNIVSDKINPAMLEESVRKIATAHRLQLTIKQDATNDLGLGKRRNNAGSN